MTNLPPHQLQAVVYGHVQGVSFRHYTRLTAQRLGLVGWVRNRPDGTVETVAEGDKGALYRFIAFLRDGSPAAHVTDVRLHWHAATGEFRHFDIR
jgi:acylphosphatase